MTFINVMLHFGTLIAVVVAFRMEIAELFQKPFTKLFMLVAATVPAALVGLLFEDKIDALFSGERGALYLSVCFGVTAVLLLVCEYVVNRRKKNVPFGWRNAVVMGAMQAVAVLPGISRSGSTIVAGTLAGAKTEEASKFSFLMSIPIILGSVIIGLKGAIIDEPQTLSSLGAAGIVGIAVGIAAAAISGLLALRLMKKIMKKANYKWFAFYLLLLSLTTLWLSIQGIL